MTTTLENSYAYCQQLAKQTAGNFYYSFLALRKEQFQAMCVLYAYMRLVDDLGDSPELSLEERGAALTHWRQELQRALDPQPQDQSEEFHPCLPAVVDMIQRYEIPVHYFFDVITGVESDLQPVTFQTFDDLADYCYHVAGVVGLCCIHIWGFHDDRAVEASIDCGLAFQLTNILRDLAEDADLGRVYLPQEDLHRFAYSQSDIQARVYDQRFRELMQFEVDRARLYYQNSERLFEYISPEGRRILKAMHQIYGGILNEIERLDYQVYTTRAGLPRWRKLLIAGEALIASRWFSGRAAR
ncbi:phytoene/squalene synthase family protein [Gimesia chilikensis]|uniref:All-trans-phytoene synthase n=1 Tax=Gimesia chilikensis TaxID=2605989 RepID=A0A517PII2_9PLAN|nr:phytoene/squalene synthase family protein [Gimesia chilikensis]QDT19200.1 All-trans-phytoene synthase [Gimesia chilikensis]